MYEEIEAQEQHVSRQQKPVTVDDGIEPFSVLILGIDTGDLGRSETGRSDAMTVLTVNPNTNQVSIVSIPRDTYSEIVGRGHMDKINHAYAFGGTSMAINSVQNLFDIPIDYYVSINMESMQGIIDAIGGIKITPTMSFNHSGNSFKKNQPTLMDGSKALSYSRMRYEDPKGDYGRQYRHRQIIEGAMQKAASFDSIRNYKGILNALSANIKTNISFDEMIDIFNNYSNSANNIEQVQLAGYGEMKNGVYYEIMPNEEVERVQNHLKNELELN